MQREWEVGLTWGLHARGSNKRNVPSPQPQIVKFSPCPPCAASTMVAMLVMNGALPIAARHRHCSDCRSHIRSCAELPPARRTPLRCCQSITSPGPPSTRLGTAAHAAHAKRSPQSSSDAANPGTGLRHTRAMPSVEPVSSSEFCCGLIQSTAVMRVPGGESAREAGGGG